MKPPLNIYTNPITGGVTIGLSALPPCHIHSPLHPAWLARVAELEAEGCTTSDAQSIADIEITNP